MIPSIARSPSRSACIRKSGPESTSSVRSPARTTTDERNRLSRGFSDRHTGQSQPITGTPTEVPVPRNVKEKSVTRETIGKLEPGATHPMSVPHAFRRHRGFAPAFTAGGTSL